MLCASLSFFSKVNNTIRLLLSLFGLQPQLVGTPTVHRRIGCMMLLLYCVFPLPQGEESSGSRMHVSLFITQCNDFPYLNWSLTKSSPSFSVCINR